MGVDHLTSLQRRERGSGNRKSEIGFRFLPPPFSKGIEGDLLFARRANPLGSLSGWGLQAAAALRFVTLRFGEIPNILEYSRLNCDALS